MADDKTLSCKDCGNDFTFTASEQEFYASKGFTNEPGRCPECRRSHKQQRGFQRGPREMHDAVCSNCGIETQVPFKPSGERPVLCNDCFKASKAA
jgi:CxxC-x17-CxxC domain-containing protein